ncbi:MAG TPA: hypothetical protein VKY74_09205 [Chloroflexia bacterium]|nr:hypothetical protein [Chloroflexia bacterium]
MVDERGNATRLFWRAAETIAWCLLRTVPSDPRWSLRSPALTPQGYRFDEWGEDIHGLEPDPRFAKSEDLSRVVSELAEQRARLLHMGGMYPDSPAAGLIGGRLLCYAPYENLSEGSEEPESRGFYDVWAAPPWDTWIAWVDTPTVYRAGHATSSIPMPAHTLWTTSYIVCWVPDTFIELADAGLGTSTTNAIMWAENLDAEWLQYLRAKGVLPDGAV